MTTEDDIQKLKAAAEKATPGERRFVRAALCAGDFIPLAAGEDEDGPILRLRAQDHDFFLLANPAQVLALIDRQERLERALDDIIQTSSTRRETYWDIALDALSYSNSRDSGG